MQAACTTQYQAPGTGTDSKYESHVLSLGAEVHGSVEELRIDQFQLSMFIHSGRTNSGERNPLSWAVRTVHSCLMYCLAKLLPNYEQSTRMTGNRVRRTRKWHPIRPLNFQPRSQPSSPPSESPLPSDKRSQHQEPGARIHSPVPKEKTDPSVNPPAAAAGTLSQTSSPL
jgi:hypothetical protein